MSIRKKWFKTLKRDINKASTKEEVKEVYERAKARNNWLTPGQGVLLNEMIQSKINEIKEEKL